MQVLAKNPAATLNDAHPLRDGRIPKRYPTKGENYGRCSHYERAQCGEYEGAFWRHEMGLADRGQLARAMGIDQALPRRSCNRRGRRPAGLLGLEGTVRELG